MILSILPILKHPENHFPVLTVDGENKLASFKPIDPFFTFSCLKNSDNKYYFAGMGRTDVGRDPFVYKYNPATNQIEQEFRVEMGAVNNFDTHRKPALNIDGSGNLFLVAETLQPEVNGHGTNLEVYKTTTPYDITTLELLATITGRYAYPAIHVSGSNVYVTARGSDDTVNFIRDEFWLYKSSDGGATFDAGRPIYDSGDPQKVAYFQRVHDYSGNLYYLLNERDNDLQNWRYIALIKSLDGGVTFSNASGSFSKNIDSSGPITRAEMVANCLIQGSPDINNIASCFEGGVVKSNGDIKLIHSLQSLTGNVINGNPEIVYDQLRFINITAGVVSYNQVTIPVDLQCYWAYERPIQYINSDESFDDIAFVDFTDNHTVKILRSVDDFATQTTKVKVEGNDNYIFGQGAFNVADADDYLLVIVDPQGITTSGASESLGDYSNLLVLPVAQLPDL